jgi:spore coat protein SA
MSMVAYHILTEAEPFSEFHGGAISRWAANVLRNAPSAIVIAPSADNSWQFSERAVWVLPKLAHYRLLRRYLLRLPWLLHAMAIRNVFHRLLKQLRRGDIVWIHNRPDFAVALTPYVHRAGGKVVLHLHNSHLAEWPRALMEKVCVDRLVFVSEFLLEQARRRFPSLGTSTVLYNGADSDIFYPARCQGDEAKTPTVLFAGRLVKDKGVHILIDAMRLLERRGVRIQAHIVGASNFGASGVTEYVAMIQRNAPLNVTFLSYRSGSALGDLFREADIFCSPSLWDEPFGLVNVEAFASALPVVSTLGGGISEVFRDGGGILVKRGCVEQLASALQRLAEDGELRATLGQQGYASFQERFTWSIARTQVQDICRSVSS